MKTQKIDAYREIRFSHSIFNNKTSNYRHRDQWGSKRGIDNATGNSQNHFPKKLKPNIETSNKIKNNEGNERKKMQERGKSTSRFFPKSRIIDRKKVREPEIGSENASSGGREFERSGNVFIASLYYAFSRVMGCGLRTSSNYGLKFFLIKA